MISWSDNKDGIETIFSDYEGKLLIIIQIY